MAIPCKGLFELTLIKYPCGQRQEETLLYCSENLEALVEWPEAYCMEVVENTDYDLYFNADCQDAKLYIEGLEHTPSDNVYYDEKRQLYYRKPEPYPFTWFRWDQSVQSLIPGQYYVKIQVRDKMYYTLLKVCPRRIEAYQLMRMKQEIKTFLGELQTSILHETLCERSIKAVGDKQEVILEKLAKWEKQLIYVLIEMKRQPHEQVEKTYDYTLKERCQKIDPYAIRRTLRQQCDEDKGYSYTKAIAYDTPENRWFKGLNERLIHFLTEIHLGSLSQQDRERCLRIQYTCQSMRQLDWYDKIPYRMQEQFPIRSMYESRFRILHQFEKDLWHTQTHWVLDYVEEHLYQQTSWLYEVWGLIKTFHLLTEELGYSVQKQNLQKMDFWLVKGNRRIHLVYDQMIPIHPHQTSVYEQPLYALSPIHRRPDGRLDLYDEKGYRGTLIVEFKYSHENHVWHEERKTRCSEQILHYGYQLQSAYKANPYDLPKALLRQINPIHGVLVCIPHLRNGVALKRDEDTHITLAALKPDDQYQDLIIYLKKELEQIGYN